MPNYDAIFCKLGRNILLAENKSRTGDCMQPKHDFPFTVSMKKRLQNKFAAAV